MITTIEKDTVLMEACSLLLVEGVQMLLATGADVNQQDCNQSYSLHYLAMSRFPGGAEHVTKASAIITMLRNAGVNVTVAAKCKGQGSRAIIAKELFEDSSFPDLGAMLL